jgi:hypothetical protein
LVGRRAHTPGVHVVQRMLLPLGVQAQTPGKEASELGRSRFLDS